MFFKLTQFFICNFVFTLKGIIMTWKWKTSMSIMNKNKLNTHSKTKKIIKI